MYFGKLCFLAQFALTSAKSIILPSESILARSNGAWHNSKDVELQYQACFQEKDFDYADSSTLVVPSSGWKKTQYDSLMSLYTSTAGANWKVNSNWGVGDPCSQGWHGIECDCNGRVIKISLPDNRLVGTVPSGISGLVYLLELDLHTTSKYVHSVANPDANKLSGVLPSLSALTRLSVLDVSQNLLTGLPVDIHLTTNLEVLSASGNALTVLPANLGQLTKLRILELNDNVINDKFPATSICAMSEIYVLNLGNSTLKGPFYNACLKTLNPLVFDVSAVHPSDLSAGDGLTGAVPIDLVQHWTNIDQGYISFYLQLAITGHIASTCVDLRFCRWFNFRSHGDLAYASAADIPQGVYDTITAAR